MKTEQEITLKLIDLKMQLFKKENESIAFESIITKELLQEINVLRLHVLIFNWVLDEENKMPPDQMSDEEFNDIAILYDEYLSNNQNKLK